MKERLFAVVKSSTNCETDEEICQVMKRRDSFSTFLPRRRHSRRPTDVKSSESETLLNIFDSDETNFRKAEETRDGLRSRGNVPSWQNGSENQNFDSGVHRTASTPRLFYGKSDSNQVNKRTKTPLKYNSLRGSFSTTAFHQSVNDPPVHKEESQPVSNELFKKVSFGGFKPKSSTKLKSVAEKKV